MLSQEVVKKKFSVTEDRPVCVNCIQKYIIVRNTYFTNVALGWSRKWNFLLPRKS